MKHRGKVAAVIGAVALSATAFVPAAHANGQVQQRTAAACSLTAGSITTSGAHAGADVTAGTPPTMSAPGSEPKIFAPGAVRLSSSFVAEPNVGGVDRSGYVVEGDNLYYRFYNFNDGGNSLTRIGSGWSKFTAFEIAEYDAGPGRSGYHNLMYGLRNDGTLFRWSASGESWRRTGTAAGFSSVKSMALISKTATYDTFLANTRGGALYTIRIPVTSPMKPIVKQVRTRSWQGFEYLIAAKCGKAGTLLLGIDKDTKTGYLYAVGHANGTATVINGLGKVKGTFPDPVYHRWTVVADLDPLNGD
ncbi:hypothetical protein ACQHIV_04110 [Kribbella sp. GL6]|uniref:hypothetical protein n=1 Tax=Kribbella sp. GL6 TaxID=3419765 RepID=UPI003CFF9921